MKTKTKAYICVLLWLVTILLLATPWTHAEDVMVERVLDGDTVVVKYIKSNQYAKIRLYGIDAPENAQPYGIDSKRYLKMLIEGREVDMEVLDVDKYGRFVATLYDYSTGCNVNRTMVESGYAWVYPHYCKLEMCDEWYEKQKKAVEYKRGLWQSNRNTPPWKWRQ